MKIILLENIKNLGKKGELKEVADGYARNFLLPEKNAEIASPEAINRLEKNRKIIQNREKEEEEEIKKIASEIQGKKITIKAKAKKNKLFGSIGKKEIFQELKKEGFNIEEKSILLENPIKEIGEKEVDIMLGKNIKATITVTIQES